MKNRRLVLVYFFKTISFSYTSDFLTWHIHDHSVYERKSLMVSTCVCAWVCIISKSNLNINRNASVEYYFPVDASKCTAEKKKENIR